MITLLRFPVPVDARFRELSPYDKLTWHRANLFGLIVDPKTGGLKGAILWRGSPRVVTEWRVVDDKQFHSAVSGN